MPYLDAEPSPICPVAAPAPAQSSPCHLGAKAGGSALASRWTAGYYDSPVPPPDSTSAQSDDAPTGNTRWVSARPAAPKALAREPPGAKHEAAEQGGDDEKEDHGGTVANALEGWGEADTPDGRCLVSADNPLGIAGSGRLHSG